MSLNNKAHTYFINEFLKYDISFDKDVYPFFYNLHKNKNNHDCVFFVIADTRNLLSKFKSNLNLSIEFKNNPEKVFNLSSFDDGTGRCFIKKDPLTETQKKYLKLKLGVFDKQMELSRKATEMLSINPFIRIPTKPTISDLVVQTKYENEIKRLETTAAASSTSSSSSVEIRTGAGSETCEKCFSVKTSSTQRQTRGADEGMTVFVTCLDCG